MPSQLPWVFEIIALFQPSFLVLPITWVKKKNTTPESVSSLWPWQSTIIVEKTVQDLLNLMHDLSAYSDQFLNMVCVKLQEYKDTCAAAYRWVLLGPISATGSLTVVWLVRPPSEPHSEERTTCELVKGLRRTCATESLLDAVVIPQRDRATEDCHPWLRWGVSLDFHESLEP